VIRTLRDLGCPCILGNHDAFLIEPELVAEYTKAKVIVEAIDWCRAQLTPDDLAFVRTFARELELPLGGDRRLLLYHGSPESNVQDVLATTTDAELDELLAGRTAAVMAGGHTHIQMLRQHRGTLLVNPGSVGLPFKEYVAGGPPTVLAHAEYAIVEGREDGVGVDLRRVALDRETLRNAAADSDVPMRHLLMRQYS
jgi:predicted phosphodiesterase